MSDDEQVRRSERTTRGIPPVRLGEWDAGTLTTQGEGLSGQRLEDADPTSRNVLRRTNSVSSFASSNASVKQVRLRLEAQQLREKAEQEAKLRVLEDRYKQSKAEQDAKQRALQSEIDHANTLIQVQKLEHEADLLAFEDESDTRDSHSFMETPRPVFTSTPRPKPQRERQERSRYSSNGSDDSNPDYKKIVQAMSMLILKEENKTQSAKSSSDTYLARQIHGRDLPPFSGKAEEWTMFKATYEMTTKDCAYNEVANLRRLQRCLKGDAMELVQGLLCNASNVTKVMEKLESRFGRPEYVIKSLIQQAKGSPSAKEDKPESIIKFGTAVESLVSTIEALKAKGYLNNPILVDELESKLSPTLRVDWIRWVTGNAERSKDLECFRKWTSDYVEVACQMCPPKPPEEKDKNKKNKKDKDSHVLTTSKESLNHDTKKPYNAKCLFCDGSHKVHECKKLEGTDLASRLKWIQENKMCLNCIKPGHFAKECRSKERCKVDGCGRKHHALVHDDNFIPKKKENKTKEKKSSNVQAIQDDEDEDSEAELVGVSEQVEHMLHNNMAKVVYKVLPVTLQGPKGTLKTYAMLDDGSAFSVIDLDTAKQLGLTGESHPLRFRNLGKEVKTSPSQRVSLKISNPINGATFDISGVQTFNNLSLRGGSLSTTELKRWSFLKNSDLPTYEKAQPKLLIGLPHAYLMAPLKALKSPRNAPIVVQTRLGWVAYGQLELPQETEIVDSIMLVTEDQDIDLHRMVKNYFSTEDFGVKAAVSPNSPDEIKALEIAQTTLRKRDQSEHYEIGLFWRGENINLPASRNAALKRLQGIERRMEKDPSFAEQYEAKFQYYQDVGYMRKLEQEEVNVRNGKTWYLPHFGVVNPNKPNKIRLVFDAAAVSNGTSLNNNLLKGPDNLVPLAQVLMQFRQRKIALSADIKEMFHQVKIRKEDLSAQRLLWRGRRKDIEPQEYVMEAMTFGSTCSPFSAQYVKNHNARIWEEDYPEAAKVIIHHHYVDDLLYCTDTPEEAILLCPQVIEVQRRGGFEICNWISNDKEVIKSIPQYLRAASQKAIQDKDGLDVEKVLGLRWDPDLDNFIFSANLHRLQPEMLKGKVPTKRQAFSVIMSLYDPLGFVAPLTIKAKILLQRTWRSGIGWDEELPPDIHKKWLAWIKELQGIGEFKISRCYSEFFSKSPDIQLHVFCDASQQAFAAAAYFRIKHGEEVHTTLVMAKTRVTPLKSLSIPRCELQGAVMATRLAATIKEVHQVKPHRTIYWTDSSTVLDWIKIDSHRLKQFASHRIGEIQEATNANEWRYIPTNENVADEATRDDKPSALAPGSRWVNGPKFLMKEESQWPQRPAKFKITEEELQELKTETIGVLALEQFIPPIDITRFSKWQRLIRTTAYAKRIAKQRSFRLNPGPLSLGPSDIRTAEESWWKWAQQQDYAHEIKQLKKGKPLTSDLYKFSPFLDTDGILRMKGRRQLPVLGGQEENPIILHPKNPYTVLMIQYYHEKAKHYGMDRVTNDLKSRFCIPKLRAAVRRSWTHCQDCAIKRAQPHAPEMGNIPETRLGAFQRPFTYTGLDYFGPMEVTVKRSREKRYGALFTCLTTRAVHVEIANCLDTDSCIQAIRRFTSVRGQPKEIWSDNGSNFVGAEREMKKSMDEIDQDKMNSAMTTEGTAWHFIPPYAPHMGGCWERMVRSIKTALKVILKERSPREETLRTAIAEAMNIVNGHPLTYVSSDPDDDQVLTPNHFLIGSPNHQHAPGEFTERDLIPGRQWRYAQRLVDHFWTRWIQEFLPTLTRRTKWFQPQKPLEIGDIVLIVDDKMPRNSWPKGIITEVFKAKDGQTRSANVKTSTGTYKRPTVKICVLNVKQKGAQDSSHQLKK